MVPVIRAPQAEQDLADIADFLARRSPRTSLRFLDAAEAAFQRLADFPELGSRYESPNPQLAQLRFWPIPTFENYLIFYRISPQQVDVVRVVQGAQNLEKPAIPRGRKANATSAMTSTTASSTPSFKLGDRVRILLSELRGRIVELRGPLGPGGAQIYRVRTRRKPKPVYIEVREDQLEAIPDKDSAT